MKKRFLSKSLIAKIALVLVIILVFEFAASEPVHAASLGGTLLNPIVNLVVYLADGVIQILQSALTSIENSFSYIDITESHTSWWAGFWMIVGGLVVAAAAIFFTAGAATPAVVAAVGASVARTGLTVAAAGGIYLAVYPKFGKKLDSVVFGNSFVYSTIYITPETILKNQIKLFDVDYFHTFEDAETNTDKTVSLSNTLKNVVSQVYTTIRDVALVAMLIVIIYIAIRMLLALTPKEKSRYKESAVNCVIGLILIIVMHFIMSISVATLQMITNSIAFTNQIYDITLDEIDTKEEMESFLASNPDVYNNIQGPSLEIVGDELYDAVENPDKKGTSIYAGIVLEKNGNEKITYVKASNFTEQARYMAQKIYDLGVKEYNEDGTVKEYDRDKKTETWEHIGWAFVYIMLVVLTLAFVLMYGKRAVYMAALTIFAPVVGVMYPINRANGSRAHTLNLWFKEYMGNLIIQPFHLFIYTILIGSAMDMAINNPVYVIIAIMGLMFIEKLLKDLLGIQDTRIGSLGKSLQDTTRAIKTTEKMATSIARTVGRTVSRGAHVLGGVAVGLAAKEAAPEESLVNNTPRVQQTPPNSGAGGGNTLPPPEAPAPVLPPPTAEAQNPQALGEELDNVTRRPQEKKLDEAASMQKYMSEGGRQNADGEYFNPYTDEFDANYNPLTDTAFQVYGDGNSEMTQELDEQATMQRYMNEGGRQNADGEYFRPDIDEFDANYDPLTDPSFQVYGNENTGIDSGLDSGVASAGVLDDTTMSMVDDLNGNQTPFRVIDGTSERVIATDGERNGLKDDQGNLRIERINPSDGRDPMAMAMAAGGETSSSSVTTGSTENLRSVGNKETVLESGNTATNSSHTSNNSGVTSFSIPSGAQNIPDGNNLRVVNDSPNSQSSDKITDFESKAQERRQRRASTGASIPIDNNGTSVGADAVSARNKHKNKQQPNPCTFKR